MDYKPNNKSAYPFDFEAMEKGQTITQDAIEKHLGFTADSNRDAYRLAVMSLISLIERTLDAAGKPATVKADKLTIRICTDSEAIVHTKSQWDQSVRRGLKNFFRMCNIDPEQVDQEEQRQLNHNLFVTSRVIAAQQAARVKAAAELRRRTINQ